MDGIPSDLDEPDEEEEEGGTGPFGLQEGSPRTPDQEQFLKQHFETLANGAAPGGVRGQPALLPSVQLGGVNGQP